MSISSFGKQTNKKLDSYNANIKLLESEIKLLNNEIEPYEKKVRVLTRQIEGITKKLLEIESNSEDVKEYVNIKTQLNEVKERIKENENYTYADEKQNKKFTQEKERDEQLKVSLQSEYGLARLGYAFGVENEKSDAILEYVYYEDRLMKKQTELNCANENISLRKKKVELLTENKESIDRARDNFLVHTNEKI